MAEVNTSTTLTDLLKQTYADEIEDNIPEGLIGRDMFKFIPKKQQPGNAFNVPIALSRETGVTYYRGTVAGTASGGAFTLRAAEAAAYANATIVGAQMVIRGQLDYETAHRAQRGPRAFRSAAGLLVENLTESLAHRVEIDIWNGRTGIGVVESVDHTANTFVVREQDWIPGVWCAGENAFLEFSDTALATATQRTGTVSISQVSAVNMDTRTITALVDLPTDVVAGDIIWYAGQVDFAADLYNVGEGVDSMLNPGATLFGVSTTKSVFKPSALDVGSDVLTYGDVNYLVAKIFERGGMEAQNLVVSARCYANLIDEEVAVRRWPGPTKPQFTVGAESITFFAPNGRVTVKASNHIRLGRAYLFPANRIRRVGATDITFEVPGGETQFLHIPDKAGYELRMYSNQSPFTAAPAKCGRFTGIVNAAA